MSNNPDTLKPDQSAISLEEAINRLTNLRFSTYAGLRGYIEKTKGELTCGDNCSHCCYQKIAVSAADGAAIYKFMVDCEAWNSEWPERLREADKQIAQYSHADWLAKKVPCVFLKDVGEGPGRGTCTVYPARPPGCGLMFSQTDNPEKCADVGGQDTFQVVPGREVGGSIHRISEVVARSFKAQHWVFTLPGSVLYAYCFANGLDDPGVARLDMRNTKRKDNIAQQFDRKAYRWIKRQKNQSSLHVVE